jgi:hypothetical protein
LYRTFLFASSTSVPLSILSDPKAKCLDGSQGHT